MERVKRHAFPIQKVKISIMDVEVQDIGVNGNLQLRLLIAKCLGYSCFQIPSVLEICKVKVIIDHTQRTMHKYIPDTIRTR